MAQILVKKEDQPGVLSEGLLQKFGQGGTLGWRDELSARLSAAMSQAFDPNAGRWDWNTPQATYERELARQRGQEQAYAEANPIAATVGELAGGLALGGGTVGGVAKAGMALKPSLMAASGMGMGEGALYGAGAANEGDRLGGAATGAMMGSVLGPLGYAGGRMATRVFNRLQDAKNRSGVLARGERMGYEYTPAQRSGLSELEIREAAMRRDPASARNFLESEQRNQLISNRQAAAQIGEDATQLTEDVIDNAATRLEREFGNLGGLQGIKIGNRTLTELADLEQNYQAMWGTTKLKVLDDAVDEFTDLATKRKPLSAERYQYLHSQLGKMLKTYRKDPQKLEVIGGLRDILNNAVEDSLGKNQLGRWRMAREQWRALQTMMKPGVIRDGNISEPSLYQALRRDNPLGLMRGQSAQPGLEDVGVAGALTKRKLQSSGTAEALIGNRNMRQLFPDILSNAKTKTYLKNPQWFLQNEGPGAYAGVPGLLSTSEQLQEYIKGLMSD